MQNESAKRIDIQERRSYGIRKVRYSSKIIKAGAFLADTKTLLSHRNTEASVNENIKRIRNENLFGKGSRSRVDDIVAISGIGTYPKSPSRNLSSFSYPNGFLLWPSTASCISTPRKPTGFSTT